MLEQVPQVWPSHITLHLQSIITSRHASTPERYKWLSLKRYHKELVKTYLNSKLFYLKGNSNLKVRVAFCMHDWKFPLLSSKSVSSKSPSLICDGKRRKFLECTFIKYLLLIITAKHGIPSEGPKSIHKSTLQLPLTDPSRPPYILILNCF